LILTIEVLPDLTRLVKSGQVRSGTRQRRSPQKVRNHRPWSLRRITGLIGGADRKPATTTKAIPDPPAPPNRPGSTQKPRRL